jgi:hypothetical protein
VSAVPGDPLAVLIGLLRQAGFDPAAEEVADAVWLARWAAPAAAEPGPAAAPPVSADPATEAAPPREEQPPVPEPDPLPRQRDPVEPERFALYPGSPDPSGGGGGGGGGPAAGADAAWGPALPSAAPPAEPSDGAFPVRVPAASALPGLLDLQRAMRPLQHFRPPVPPVRHVLDEQRTAERSAGTGLVLPVFRADERHEATMQLLMDASSSMVVWRRMLEEVRQVCEQLGAFRDVQVHYLHRGDDGAPLVGAGPEPDGRLRGADQLRDPTGRRLTLLVSDCAGPLWRDGQAQRLLYRWAAHAPVAVLQPLPQRMWGRSALPAEPGRLLRDAGPTARLEFRPDRRGPRPVPARRPGALCVPVLPPTRTALGAWARLLSGAVAASVRGAVAWVHHDHPAVPGAREGARRPAAELVEQFQAVASVDAFKLAVYLAAAPLNLPVMQLVQRTMLPHTGPSELAEVLLSGLLTRSGPPAADDAGQWYEFVDGVHDLLLRPLGRGDAVLVLKHVSQHVEQHFGRGARNFPALAMAYLSGAPETAEPRRLAGRAPAARVPQPFAEVAGRVVRRYLHVMPEAEPGPPAGPPPAAPAPAAGPDDLVAAARAAVDRYRREGSGQDLFTAVQFLRRAGDGARADLAAALLLMWEAEGDPGALREAREAAEAAVAAATPGGIAAVGHAVGSADGSADSGADFGAGGGADGGLGPEPGADRQRALLRATRILGQVLHECARARAEDGAAAEAAALLHEAEAQFDRARMLSVMLREQRLHTVADLASVQYELWSLTGEEGALIEAAGALRTMFEAGWPEVDGSARMHLLYGRVLLARAGRPGPDEERRAHAHTAVAHLRRSADLFAEAAGARPPGLADPDEGCPDEPRCSALLDLAEALKAATGSADDVPPVLTEALHAAGDDTALRARCHVAMGRARAQRALTGDAPAELAAAADAFAQAARLLPRGSARHNAVLGEWAAVLLRRAQLPEGADAAVRAVQVARDCVRETPERHPEAAARRLLLGRAVFLRHRYQGDLTDLYEAEDVLARAARSATEPVLAAMAWLENGDVHRALYARSRNPSPARLERAADAYRRAWQAVHAHPAPTVPALRLAARAQHRRGEVFEQAVGPRSALEAYRTADADWRRTPDEGGPEATHTRNRIQALTH